MNKLKYLGYSIVFQEVPNEVSLAINISGCPCRCEGCHSKYLWEYKGNYISDDLPLLLDKYKGMITCVCFMGGDQNTEELIKLCKYCHTEGYKTCLYTGHDLSEVSENLPLDYLKVGSYKEEYGGLNKKTTNQRMYSIWKDKIFNDTFIVDITKEFQKEKTYNENN